jgi:peptidoglycan hydrolase-like protein with peptidoglycan-binding domain
VEQLEGALVALGYDPDGLVEVDETFDWYTRQMVLDWQADIGAPEDGTVGIGDVVYLAEPVTVDEVRVAVGDQLQGNGVAATVYTTSSGTEGADVEQLESALDRLGFTTGVVDGRFGAATRTAVIRWQESVGAETDGIVDLGEVIFLPEPVRVAELNLAVGDEVRSGSQVFAATSDSITVAVDLAAADQDLVFEGLVVTVVLPDGTESPGTVTSVASVARRNDQTGATTFDVRVELEDVSVAAGLDEAPVDVEVVTDFRPDVMAVPVTALVALAEGGYAVEVDSGEGTTRLVAVEPGLYADGWVEVDSNGLEPGDRVVAP